MTIRGLEIFLKVTELGSMSAAARELGISQASVSQVIVETERHYGIQLFDRCKHRLILTEQGRQLCSYARKTVRLAAETERFLLGERQCPLLRVGASATVGGAFLAPLLAKLRDRMGSVQFDVQVSNTHRIEEALLRDTLDFGVVEGVVHSEELLTEFICSDELVLVCGPEHRFYGRSWVAPEELQRESFLLREEGSGTREWLEGELRRHEIVYHIGWTAHTSAALEDAAAHHFGLAALPLRMIRHAVAEKRIWPFRVQDFKMKRSFRLAYHRDKYLGAGFQELRALCQEERTPHAPVEFLEAGYGEDL